MSLFAHHEKIIVEAGCLPHLSIWDFLFPKLWIEHSMSNSQVDLSFD
jgi:hypothetical protein